MKSRILAMGAVLLLAFALTACGGGGGGATQSSAPSGDALVTTSQADPVAGSQVPAPDALAPPITATPDPSPSTTPPSAAVEDPPEVSDPAVGISLPPSAYSDGSPERTMFDQLNRLRIAGGFGALADDALLAQSARNHLNYRALNQGNPRLTQPVDPGWTQGHTEWSDLPGFTGVYPLDRAQAAGARWKGRAWGFIGETYLSVKPYVSAIQGPLLLDFWLRSETHLASLINPRSVSAGVAFRITSPDGPQAEAVIEPGMPADGSPIARDWPLVYPYNGQRQVPVTSGLLIVATADIWDEFEAAPLFTVRLAGQSALLRTTATQGWNMPMIRVSETLRAGSRYVVEFSGFNKTTGTRMTRRWSFYTAD